MKRIKQNALALFILTALSLLLVLSVWATSVPIEVIQAAKDGKATFLESITSDQLSHFGFNKETELDNTTIGTPFRVYTIHPNDVMSFAKGDNISAVVSPTNQWFFPVECSGKSRVLLTVDLMEGKWKAVNLGAAALASEMDRVTDFLARYEDYNVRFVRIFQASSDFILLTKDEVSKVVPLAAAAYNIGLVERGETYEYSELFPHEIIPRLAPAVEMNMQMHQE